MERSVLGREFHNLGAQREKARLPKRAERKRGISRSGAELERRCRKWGRRVIRLDK